MQRRTAINSGIWGLPDATDAPPYPCNPKPAVPAMCQLALSYMSSPLLPLPPPAPAVAPSKPTGAGRPRCVMAIAW